MKPLTKRTKIVVTIGPASRSPEVMKKMVSSGMNVARLNFSHGSYDDHAQTIAMLRQVSQDLNHPITLLQDLQGPKIRVGQLSTGEITLIEGDYLTLVPIEDYHDQPHTVSIDYPFLAEEATVGTQILLDDGLLELCVEDIQGTAVKCQIIDGGILKSRKGVNLPSLNLRLPSMTEKDVQDLEFGLSQGIDWVSLSFVRKADDIRILKALLEEKGHTDVGVIAKIEKPQAIANIEEIVAECDGLMVARGDLGVEISPERVPLLQKQIIKLCNMKAIPVITATQMLESMIKNPRPTRAEASDVANAIIDGTDAVMLSGESAIGDYPIKAVEMLAKIAMDIEKEISFENNRPEESDETHAITEALDAIDSTLNLRCIATFTTSGYTAILVSKERPRSPVVAITPVERVYHRLNLVWGIIPVLLDVKVQTFEEIVNIVDSCLKERNLAQFGDKVLITGGIPFGKVKSTNFLKIHTIN
ncbi:pyruvate kinase [Aphanothece hegewaldii CCALA 016]|uniref:Pyruvate kinase n=1 Tax=Aphanothece hegewaldii CCALA 016 TaxID=2107694 RepID=A0A2T1LU61_9CHRO|nr:pyruvate kinase [Aphanothece hegewaldii]PSF34549.1 pyruvate kinase [Aphanothece hegewaldii CCALA 016]